MKSGNEMIDSWHTGESCFVCASDSSLFQALGQWGGSKKRARDERDLVKKKIGGQHSISPIDREPRPSLFVYQTPLVARRSAAFDKPH